MSDPPSDRDREAGRDADGPDHASDGRRRGDGHDPNPDADGRRRDGTHRDPEAGSRRGEPDRRGSEGGRRRRDGDRRRRRSGRRDAEGRKPGSRGGDRVSADHRDTRMYGIDRANPPTAGRADDRAGAHAAAGASSQRWLSGVVSVVGLWIAASAVVYDAAPVELWNNVATGGAIALLAGYGFVKTVRGAHPDAESPGVTALLGLWAVVAPLLLTYGSPPLVWSTMASGVAVGVLSGYNTYESRRTDGVESARPRI